MAMCPTCGGEGCPDPEFTGSVWCFGCGVFYRPEPKPCPPGRLFQSTLIRAPYKVRKHDAADPPEG
ncbi:hypothetical protein GCM10023205_41570 [Yinghuangia aomiensis]|uniref:Uncharacterized protein n=1 Tax=Yinghuangia aomiensis TaxID=676205 RepID=A0ABP9HI21_9ACTN